MQETYIKTTPVTIPKGRINWTFEGLAIIDHKLKLIINHKLKLVAQTCRL